MLIQISEKVSFEFTYLLLEDFGGSFGTTQLTIPLALLKPFYEEVHDNPYAQELIVDFDPMEEALRNEEDFECYMTDTHVCFFHWLHKNDISATGLHYGGDTPMWLLHDWEHGVYDTENYYLVASAQMEADCVKRSMELAKKLNMLWIFDLYIFRTFEEEFNDRFNGGFDIKHFVDLLNFMWNNE